jgi:hypothetical protein
MLCGGCSHQLSKVNAHAHFFTQWTTCVDLERQTLPNNAILYFHSQPDAPGANWLLLRIYLKSVQYLFLFYLQQNCKADQATPVRTTKTGKEHTHQVDSLTNLENHKNSFHEDMFCFVISHIQMSNTLIKEIKCLFSNL